MGTYIPNGKDEYHPGTTTTTSTSTSTHLITQTQIQIQIQTQTQTQTQTPILCLHLQPRLLNINNIFKNQ